MTHWYRDIQRDEAVRAAEDNRQGPLPTLEEAISRAGQFTSPEATQEQKCTERERVPPAPESRPAETRLTKAERIGGGWWFPKYDLPSPPPPPPPAPPRVHRGSGVFDANGDEVPWEGVVAALKADRDAAIRERDANDRVMRKCNLDCVAVMKERDALTARVAELESQLESVADRAAAAETALEKAPAASEWRILKVGETVEPGDEMSDDLFMPWRDAGPCVGQEVASGPIFFRRRVPAPAASVNSSGILTSSPAASGAAGTATWFAAVGKFGLKNVCMAFNSFGECEKFADGEVRIIPLYATPQAASGWLTAEERELIAGITDSDDYTEEGQNIAKALLARDTPPEVVLPRGWEVEVAEIRKAILAAGVTVKEVGRE